jgi:hypothetical protein
MKLPKVEHPTDRPNFTVVTLNGGDERELWLAFSYETCVGVMRPTWDKWVVRQNEWGPTTGKHMNLLNSDHGDRWNKPEFEFILERTMEENNA